jgi:DNA-binding NarL/FixJ family response regulator
MTATLASGGLPAPARANGLEETRAAAGSGDAIVAFDCNVADPGRVASLRRLRKLLPDARLIVVCPMMHASGVRRALDAGADAVVFESQLEESLVASVAAVAAGQTAVPRRVRTGLHRPVFSHRERQVLAHVATGLTNRQIADALFLAESTVKSHLASAYAKLGVRSRKEAAALLLDPSENLGVELSAFVQSHPGPHTRGLW